MKHVPEQTAYNQAKQIFNNTDEQIIEHFEEEFREFLFELKNPVLKAATIDEAGDLAYMFNQVLIQICGTDYLTVLKQAIVKNEKKKGKYEAKNPI